MKQFWISIDVSAAPWSVLGTAIVLALMSAGLIVLVRKIPWVERHTFKGVRPWACDVCMSFWVTWLTASLFTGAKSDVRTAIVVEIVAFLSAFPLCLWFLRHITQPVSDFHPPPEES